MCEIKKPYTELKDLLETWTDFYPVFFVRNPEDIDGNIHFGKFRYDPKTERAIDNLNRVFDVVEYDYIETDILKRF